MAYRRLAVLLVAVPALVITTLLQGPAALADPPADVTEATAQAEGLRAQVEQLEHEVEQAAEDHSAAVEALGGLISAEVAADADLADAQAAGSERRGEASRRARALYMSGGNAGVVAGLLDGRDLGDVLEGMRAVRTLIATDTADISTADDVLDRAVDSSAAVQDLRAQRQRFELEAAEATARAHDALAQHTALLAETDAAVVRLASEQRQREEAEALARASAAVVALGALPAAAAPSGLAGSAVQAAGEMLGRPYQWGAVGPGTFDCSGLTSWAYRQAGVTIPRTSRAQYLALPQVPLQQLAPGDLVFWASGSDPSSIHHVGLYIGEGRMVHAPRTGDVVKVSALWPGVFGAVRPVTDG